MSHSKMLVQPVHTVVRKSRAVSTIPLEREDRCEEEEREGRLVKAKSSPDSLRRSPRAERCSPGPFRPRAPLGSLSPACAGRVPTGQWRQCVAGHSDR